ncbi:lantibiotic dehydratase [Haloactinospora alba]|uniref:lantibiotic dehydratase n=1 Tax=Haloactinospora alba TaxID=405555 RepID=UPI001B870BA0|nr:lantibiotic dehydratase [Haloactinospora alba]
MAIWRQWVTRLWRQPEFAAAVTLASPVLAQRVREVCTGSRQRPKQVRRVVESLARYVLRADNRATPFGLFAGVAPVELGDGLVSHWDENHRAVARADAEWLADVATRLENCPQLRDQLLVVASNLAFVRDTRVVVGCQISQPHRPTPAEVSIRNTTAVQTVLSEASSPIAIGTLTEKVRVRFPDTPVSVVTGMVDELLSQRFLITDLRPPMSATDPLDHLLGVIETVDTTVLPTETARLVHELRRIQAELSRHNHTCPPERQRETRNAVTARMARLATKDPPVAADLRVDSTLRLPPAVQREAETAAQTLTRLSPHPHGTPEWADYHLRFLERYGIGARVPVMELLNPATGLGFPAGYRDSHLPPPQQQHVSERDRQLLALAQHAAMERNLEVVLDEETLTRLAGTTPTAPPHTELSFRLHAPAPQALWQGAFDLAVTGASRAAGTMAGRFLDLFAPADRQRMTTAYTQLPTTVENAAPVQVCCPPLYPGTDNVARAPEVLARTVPLAEPPTPTTEPVPLEDLIVTADTERLALMSLSRGQVVDPLMFNAVEHTTHTHPLARFLCEINNARAASCTLFSWGTASHLPFVPRLRYGRTILAPAQWRLTPNDLPDSRTPWPQWQEEFSRWRQHRRVPDEVNLGHGDRRLRLNLEEPAHQHLLRSELDRNTNTLLREAPPAEAFGWCHGRAHEIVVPLATTRRPAPQPTTPADHPAPTVNRDHGHLPGADGWLYAKLYAPPEQHATILTRHLPRLLADWEHPPEWWFMRYRDPHPHLRLRIRTTPETFADIAQRLSAWVEKLRHHGLTGRLQMDTYYPETGRFGTGTAMDAAEEVFIADSTAALAQLHYLAPNRPLAAQALTAASMVDLATALAESPSSGMRWLIDRIDTTSTPAPDRTIRTQTLQLTGVYDDHSALHALPGTEAITTAWHHRRTALATYRAALDEQQHRPERMLPALLHLHHVRMSGIAPDDERTCLHLARAAALSWTNRHPGNHHAP